MAEVQPSFHFGPKELCGSHTQRRCGPAFHWQVCRVDKFCTARTVTCLLCAGGLVQGAIVRTGASA